MDANWTNQTIWTGDNLPIMRGMNSGSVDLIYLDPPFNSNRNYEAPIGSKAAGASFKDAWTLDDVDVHEHGELADRNPAAYSVIDAARQSHGKGMMSYLIFMAVRLMEMCRILKDSGSIYLHCDPTASHYLKLLMDCFFGQSNFRNEIVWKRTNAPTASNYQLGCVHDTIFAYAKSPSFTINPVFIPYSDEYLKKHFNHRDKRGQFHTQPLTAQGIRYGYSGEPWHGVDVSNKGLHWVCPTALPDGLECPSEWKEMTTQDRLDWLDNNNMIYFPERGTMPRFKRYLSTSPGIRLSDVIVDVPGIQGASKEKTGYPTQKPLALLDRIIRASSNPGDLVFDPFCGCATSLVAADRLGREWAGIDISPLAIKLVNERIAEDRPGSLFGGAIAREDAPMRTDLGELPNYRTHRHRLYGEQEGICAGCDMYFPFKIMEVDHILPRSQGGTDHPDNLQLLCSACNRSKGGRTMPEWKVAQERAKYGDKP